MPVAVKELHMAQNLKELKKHSSFDIQVMKGKPYKQLTDVAMKLYKAAKVTLEKDETDEELAYTYLFRSMELWNLIINAPESKRDKTYFNLMFGKEIKDTMDSLEKHSKQLEERYAAALKSENKDKMRDQFKLHSSLVLKKRKEGKKGIGNEKSNGVISDLSTTEGKNCLIDYNLKLNTDITMLDVTQEYYDENKFIECEDLKEKLIGGFEKTLIIDTRPRNDFELSQIRSVHSVNIPGSSITAGLSANMLGKIIKDEKERCYWDQRDHYESVIILDWNSEEKDVIPGSSLHNLHNILLKWDPDCFYKSQPLILNGGYDRLLDTYPTYTTNAKIQRPEKLSPSPFIPLSDHTIEYPMSVLEEESTLKSKSGTVSGKTMSLPLYPSLPVIDRSTKPHSTIGSKDKFDEIENERIESRTETGISKQFLSNEINEDKVVGAKKTEKDFSSTKTQTKERTVVDDHSTVSRIPPRPVTPPRSEKYKVTSTVGDGDGETYLEKTKFETPARSSLKRSASSPNINKLANEESDDTLSRQPTFDRSTKPTQIQNFEYNPRAAGTDTVYFADSSKKGRGLTGLKNLGNLCYMNSIMQCISNTVPLTRELTRFQVKESSGGRRQIASEVSTLLRTLWQSDTRITSCRSLKNRVGALRHSFATMEQQDSHEFLTILVDWLHEDLNEPSNIKSLEGAEESTGEKAWGEFRKKNNSLVVDLFYGQLKSTVTCDYCQTQSILFEPFSNLSIPLPTYSSIQENKDRTFTLQECLKLYLKGETISGWVCPRCKTTRKATKKLDITKLPPVLIIHLKRFMNEMAGVGWCRKRMNMVDFPISDLNMKPYTHPESELRFHNYNLYAVSNHYGNMESGHYTAYCKNHVLNKWYKFDDQDVNEISPNEVKTSAAYILFYETTQLDLNNRILD